GAAGPAAPRQGGPRDLLPAGPQPARADDLPGPAPQANPKTQANQKTRAPQATRTTGVRPAAWPRAQPPRPATGRWSAGTAGAVAGPPRRHGPDPAPACPRPALPPAGTPPPAAAPAGPRRRRRPGSPPSG